MNKILVVDDEIKIRETIADYLRAKGFSVTLASNGKYAVDEARRQQFDLIILDVMMPVLNGLDACREIRKFSYTPVLFLSALGEESDYINGFKSGADDYISKPFPLPVLVEKINAMINRSRGVSQNNILSSNGICADCDNMSLLIDGNKVEMSNIDFKLPSYLMKNKNVIISRDRIIEVIWGYDFDGDYRVVDTHIKRIRKALGDKSDCIKTKINVGYWFEEVR